jgi:hypothetical protein
VLACGSRKCFIWTLAQNRILAMSWRALRLNYINVPVLQYMFGDGFRLQTGPQLGILTNAK